MKWIALAVAGLVLEAMAVPRIAPSDPVRWHQIPETITNRDLEDGAMRYIEGDLVALDSIIRETPRTRHLAGSVEEGMLTYVTRSRVFGFPDYTTVRQVGVSLQIFGRLRFGKSDLGVNAARIDGWIARLHNTN